MSGVPMERLGRITHPKLDSCVRVRLRSWEGPCKSGKQGRYGWFRWGANKVAPTAAPTAAPSHL